MEYNGQRYDMTDAHKTVVQTALKSGNVKWYWNNTRFRKYGGTGSVTIKAQYTDSQGNPVPDVALSVTKNVAIQVK